MRLYCFVVWLFCCFVDCITYSFNKSLINKTIIGISYQKSESTTLFALEMEIESVDPALLAFA